MRECCARRCASCGRERAQLPRSSRPTSGAVAHDGHTGTACRSSNGCSRTSARRSETGATGGARDARSVTAPRSWPERSAGGGHPLDGHPGRVGDGNASDGNSRGRALAPLTPVEDLPSDRCMLVFRWRGRVIGRAFAHTKAGSIGRDQLRSLVASSLGPEAMRYWLDEHLEYDERRVVDPHPLAATVAICTHNRPDDLRRALTALEALRPAPRRRSSSTMRPRTRRPGAWSRVPRCALRPRTGSRPQRCT